MRPKKILIALALLLALMARPVRAQELNAAWTPLFNSCTVSAGSSQTCAITGVSGQYVCLTGVQVVLDVPTSGTTSVSGHATVVDSSSGGKTIDTQIVDTVSAGSYWSWPPPGQVTVMQSAQTGTKTWTVTVPSISNGGAGYIEIMGYASPGGC